MNQRTVIYVDGEIVVNSAIPLCRNRYQSVVVVAPQLKRTDTALNELDTLFVTDRDSTASGIFEYLDNTEYLYIEPLQNEPPIKVKDRIKDPPQFMRRRWQ